MFTTTVQNNTLNLIRSMLPMDTGNLRFNGTTLTGTYNEMEFRIGGIMADYFKYLLDGKHSEMINQIPINVYLFLESALNGQNIDDWNLDSIGQNLERQELSNKIDKRNQVFFTSLSRNGISVDNILGR